VQPPTYEGPWRAPAAPPAWSPSPPPAGWGLEPWQEPPTWSGPSPLSDDQLRRLPPPPGVVGEQRPAVVALAVTLAVTGSLLWVCGLSLFLLVAAAGTSALGPAGEDGVLFHLLDDVLLRMGDGLWVPLYGFPVASVVTGFCLLARRSWTRIAHTVVGAAALGWAAWWLRDSLLGWVVALVYVGVALGVLWVPSANRWYGRAPRSPRGPVGAQLNG
jgi:hypothetical protein